MGAALRWATMNCDYIRLDHFRGFDQFWEIPPPKPPPSMALGGRPEEDLFLKLREALGGLPFFAEDLGYITPEVKPFARPANPRHGRPAIWFWR